MQLAFIYYYGVHSAIFRSFLFTFSPKEEEEKVKRIEELVIFTVRSIQLHYWLRSVKFTRIFADAVVLNWCIQFNTGIAHEDNKKWG